MTALAEAGAPPLAPPLAPPAPRWCACVDGVAHRISGSGGPTTVVTHGIGGDVDEVAPLAAALPGTRVVVELRGHGRSAPLVDGWDYAMFARDLLAVADAHGATVAVGLSLGAGAVLTAAVAAPRRFDRLALVLPAAFDRVRSDAGVERLERLAASIEAGDRDGLASALLAEQPPVVQGHRAAAIYARRRATALLAQAPPRPRGDVRPVDSAAAVGHLTQPVLVLAQDDDLLHPLPVATALAAALPGADLVVLPAGGVFWTAADRAQAALRTFVGGAT